MPKLQSFQWTIGAQGITFFPLSRNIYFGSKLIQAESQTVVTDRLGSVPRQLDARQTGERFAYYPHGQEETATSNDREKFATYTRDSTGLDYATNC